MDIALAAESCPPWSYLFCSPLWAPGCSSSLRSAYFAPSFLHCSLDLVSRVLTTSLLSLKRPRRKFQNILWANIRGFRRSSVAAVNCKGSILSFFSRLIFLLSSFSRSRAYWFPSPLSAFLFLLWVSWLPFGISPVYVLYVGAVSFGAVSFFLFLSFFLFPVFFLSQSSFSCPFFFTFLPFSLQAFPMFR